MSDHLTEEEQLETIKRWWKEYGKWIVTAVVLVVGGYFSWGAWQDQQRARAEAGSVLYTELLDTLGVEEGEALADDNRSEAEQLVEQLKTEYTDTGYGINAALLWARQAVSDNELEIAESELRWVLGQEPETEIAELTRLRLARVLAAQDDVEAALSLLDERTPPNSMMADFAEVRGDVLLKQGDTDGARQAYERALGALDGQDQNRYMLLQMKLDDIQQASAAELPGAEESA